MDEDQKNVNPEGEKPQPQDELSKLKEEKDEYLKGWQRAKADFINYKKEEMKRLEDVARYSQEEIMKELIIVLDNFDLGLRALEKNGQVEKGVYMIRTQMEDIMKRNGLSRVEIKPGDVFDPSIAEAISEVPSESPPGTVVEEIEPGYKLHSKLLRPARVTVAKEKHQ